MKTGNTAGRLTPASQTVKPQWSPVMKTGNTGACPDGPGHTTIASMEPGHEDREYLTG